MDKIKVVNIITDTNIGGAGKVLQNYLAHFNQLSYDVWVVMPKGSMLADMLEGYGATIIESEKLNGKSMDLGSILPIRSLLKELKPDIVHTHASLSSRISARLYGKCSIIYTRHCAYPPSAFMRSNVGKLLGRLVARMFSDGIIAISEAVKENLTDTGVPKEIITVMMNGVEPLKKLDEEQKRKIRSSYNIEENEKTVGIVGRLEPVKGHEYFLRAAKICLDKGMNIKFLIAGSGGSETEIKKMASDLGITENVIFTGFLKDVAPAVNILDIFINASYGTEASSLAMLEAMSIGIPVIATDFGGNPYQVENGITGIIVPVKDPKAIAEAVTEILTNSEKYKNLVQNTLLAYTQKYTAAIMSATLEKIYSKLLS